MVQQMDTQALIATVRPYYPWPISIRVETDLKLISGYLQSTALSCMDQGPIPGTDAFRLMECTQEFFGERTQHIVICAQKDVEAADPYKNQPTHSS